MTAAALRHATVVLREREELLPDVSPVLRAVQLPPGQKQWMSRALDGFIEVVEYRRGLGVRAGQEVGSATIPIVWNDTGRRGALRIQVQPSHAALSLRDVAAMMLFAQVGRWLPENIRAGEGDDFIEVVCRAYVTECRRLVRRGPARVYVPTVVRTSKPIGHLDVKDYAIARARSIGAVRCRRLAHTSQNSYNQIVEAGLYRAGLLAGNATLRRQSRLLAQLLSEGVPARTAPARPLFYGGQFAQYRWLHDLAFLLIAGTGTDPQAEGRSVFVAFHVRTDWVFQKFLTRLVGEILSQFRIALGRETVFEDHNGRSLTGAGFLLPDIKVTDRESPRIEMIVDAKYEKDSPRLSAGDYYQGYVYGDLLASRARRRPLPVVLISPAAALRAEGFRRGMRSIDARETRPVIWNLGIPVRQLLAANEVARGESREQLRNLLLAIREQPTTMPVTKSEEAQPA